MINPIGKSILIGLAGFGVQIEDMKDTYDELYIEVSVPEFSDHVDAKGNEMSGKLLIERLQEKLSFIHPNLKLYGVIRTGEIWTDSDKEAAKEDMKRQLYDV